MKIIIFLITLLTAFEGQKPTVNKLDFAQVVYLSTFWMETFCPMLSILKTLWPETFWAETFWADTRINIYYM